MESHHFDKFLPESMPFSVTSMPFIWNKVPQEKNQQKQKLPLKRLKNPEEKYSDRQRSSNTGTID